MKDIDIFISRDACLEKSCQNCRGSIWQFPDIRVPLCCTPPKNENADCHSLSQNDRPTVFGNPHEVSIIVFSGQGAGKQVCFNSDSKVFGAVFAFSDGNPKCC